MLGSEVLSHSTGVSVGHSIDFFFRHPFKECLSHEGVVLSTDIHYIPIVAFFGNLSPAPLGNSPLSSLGKTLIVHEPNQSGAVADLIDVHDIPFQQIV